MAQVKRLIESLDYNGLHKLLTEEPALANAGLPYDEKNTTLAHPLHRICDGVFSGTYTDDQGVELAKIFLEHGADINGFGLLETKDTPLITAASLLAERVGILYVDRGADVYHAGTHGGTALHWAAWTGCDHLVDRLIKAGADIHLRCIDFSASPLFWGVHGYKFSGGQNRRHQIACVKLLLAAGAERHVSNKEGTPVEAFLDPEDIELKTVLS
jgi:uncharacterized protein